VFLSKRISRRGNAATQSDSGAVLNSQILFSVISVSPGFVIQLQLLCLRDLFVLRALHG